MSAPTEQTNDLRVTVEVYSYGANEYRAAHGHTLYTEDGECVPDEDVFADDDIPAVPVQTLHMCPGCGFRTSGDCRVFDCTHNPNATSEPLEADLESDRFAHVAPKSEEEIMEETRQLHPGEMEVLVCQTLFLLASNGCREINPEQVTFLRKLLSHLPDVPKTITARSTTWSFDIEDDCGTAHINISLPITPGSSGTLNVHRADRHVDASGDYSQLEEIEVVLDDEHADITTAHSEAEDLIAKARALKGGTL